MNIDFNLEDSKRSGYYTVLSDTFTEQSGKENKGIVYKVILAAGPGRQETYFVHKEKGKWKINLLESEPMLCDEIRSEIDKIELS